MAEENSRSYLGLYVTCCIVFITWMISKFINGRRQVQQAFDIIGMQLQKLQEHLDAEEQLSLKNSAETKPEERSEENEIIIEKSDDAQHID